MNIAIVFFTYKKDAELLGQALRAVPRLRAANEKDIFDVYIFDDASAPLEVVPEGVAYKQTTFARRGNLNGIECVDGMLSAYAEVFSQGEYDWVIKCDCDNYINNVEWLRKHVVERTAHVGTCHVQDYNSGACYAMTALGVSKIQELLTDALTRKRANIAYCEDAAICRLAHMTALHTVCKHNRKNELAEDKLYHDWLAGRCATLEELKTPYSVDFKRCRWHTAASTFDSDRESAVQRMREYADFVEKSPKQKENNDE